MNMLINTFNNSLNILKHTRTRLFWWITKEVLTNIFLHKRKRKFSPTSFTRRTRLLPLLRWSWGGDALRFLIFTGYKNLNTAVEWGAQLHLLKFLEQENNLKYSDTNEEPRSPTPTALPTLIMLSTPSSGALPPINAAKEVCKGQFSRLSSKNGLRVNYWCPSSCPASLFMSHFSVYLSDVLQNEPDPDPAPLETPVTTTQMMKLTYWFERTIYQKIK